MDRRRFSGLPAPLGDEFFGLDRPLVESDEAQLVRAVEAAVEDEAGTAPEYERIASKASELGLERVAETFSNAAEDERRHRQEFMELLDEWGNPEEY